MCSGARVEDVDLAVPLADDDVRQILAALGERGVLCFPGQTLDAARARRVRRALRPSSQRRQPLSRGGHPEVMILSNMVENGRPIGFADAGQGWHTD